MAVFNNDEALAYMELAYDLIHRDAVMNHLYKLGADILKHASVDKIWVNTMSRHPEFTHIQYDEESERKLDEISRMANERLVQINKQAYEYIKKKYHGTE